MLFKAIHFILFSLFMFLDEQWLLNILLGVRFDNYVKHIVTYFDNSERCFDDYIYC